MLTGEGEARSTGRMMAWVIAGVNVLLLMATALAAPAPVTVGVFELALGGVLALSLVIVAGGILAGAARLQSRTQLIPVLLLPLLALPLLASVAVATARGVPLDAAARAALPYLAFLPVALLGLVGGPRARVSVVTIPLTVVGMAQSLYVLGLFGASVADPTDTRSVWLSRITLLDPRTTLPLFLAGALLPLAGFGKAGSLGKGLRLIPLALGIAGALATQTRSQLAALLAGVGAVVTFVVLWRAASQHRSWAPALVKVAVVGVLGLVLTVAVLYLIPQTRALLEAIVLRTQTSLDTGRVADEWIPALNAVLDQGVGGMLGGLGSGQTFITGSGEERTYIHNVVLYSLVYLGIPGLCVMLLVYVALVAGLWHRARLSGDPRYLGLAALIVALFAYAQFFAVHKLFSYNLMLALVAQALVQPPPVAREPG